MTPAGVFVTGMQRSGTTLFERLVGAHPRVSILSQPFPLVFVEAKRAFLRTLTPNEEDLRYPLAHLFAEDRYRPAEFTAFLSRYRPSADTLLRSFAEMVHFTGQYTRPNGEHFAADVRRLAPGDFAATTRELYRLMSDTPGAALYGGKETLCEEFLPHFLERGWAALVVVRDPRDVLASLNHGRGGEHGGSLKPTLFNIRNWRKSVAFALHLDGHPRFAWLRYEDLVTRPREALAPVATVLDVEPFTERMLDLGVRSPDGGRWRGNSSHREHAGISAASVGTYREVLPPEVTAYVEAACYAELRCLGLPTSIDPRDVPDILAGFREPYEVARTGLPSYSTAPANVAAEIRRAELACAPGPDAHQGYFLFADVHARLRHALLDR